MRGGLQPPANILLCSFSYRSTDSTHRCSLLPCGLQQPAPVHCEGFADANWCPLSL